MARSNETHGAVTVGIMFGTTMLAVAAFAAGRAFIGWRTGAATDVQVDAHHILMGVSMAGMLVPGLGFVVSGPWAAIWLVVWGVVTAWFATSVIRAAVRRSSTAPLQGHHLPHLVMSAAMVPMFAVAVSGHRDHEGAGMSAMPSGTAMLPPWPTLAAMILVLVAVFAVLVLDRFTVLSTAEGDARVGVRVLLAPRAAGAESVLMSVAMAFMLATALA